MGGVEENDYCLRTKEISNGHLSPPSSLASSLRIRLCRLFRTFWSGCLRKLTILKSVALSLCLSDDPHGVGGTMCFRHPCLYVDFGVVTNHTSLSKGGRRMIKPVRLLSLGVCAAIGGAAAFVIATQKIDGEILPESPPPQGIALESEPRPQVERAPATPIQDTDVFTAPSDEIPLFEPRMASATDDDLTFNERVSGFTNAMAPVDEPPLVPVPDTQAVVRCRSLAQVTAMCRMIPRPQKLG